MKNGAVMQSETMKAVQEALARILPSGGEAYLYGSRARGDARPDSDWDVLVLLGKDRITIDDDASITLPLKLLGYEQGQEINPQLFTFKEWQRYSSSPFNHSVTTDRLRIV